jgi:polyhydroxybutyrate depolymerase
MTPTAPLPPGPHTPTLTTADGRERSYLLHVPARYDPARPTPVVLAFHGATSNARLMQQFSGLSAKAEEAGFLIIYPNGTGNLPTVLTWNGGDCCGYAVKHNVDDVAFVRALLDDLTGVMNVDPRRIFVAGMSNGAQMVYRLAAELADRIAAVAAVAGPMGAGDPRPARPIPVLHIHGTDDQFAPFGGGVGSRSVYGANFRSVEETVRAWVRVNGCPAEPQVLEEAPHVADGTRIVRKVFGPGRAGSEVVQIIVEGGGHTWPGRPPLPAALGKSTANLSANDVIWDFFQRHPLP